MQALSQQVQSLEKELQSPKNVALVRMSLLEGTGSGFPSFFLPMMRDSLKQWMGILQSDRGDHSLLSDALEAIIMLRCLRICKKIAEMDPTLNEEVGREGSHALLSKLLKIDGSGLEKEEDQDTVMEIQDMACEIASMSKSFPLRVAPFTEDELCKRLPLSFPILPATSDCVPDSSTVEEHGGVLVLINQVNERQSAQKDVGFGKKEVAMFLLDHITCPHLLFDERNSSNVAISGRSVSLAGIKSSRSPRQTYS
jgi:hypothetical protein